MEKTKDYIFGIRAVIESVESGKTIHRLLIKRGLQGDLFHEMMTLVKKHGIPYQLVPQEKLNRITRKNHQGVIAFLSFVDFYDLEQLLPALFEQGKNPAIMILDRISDVRNFGAISRTAECAGFDAVVIPGKEAAHINADAMKTSAGALNYIPVCRTKSLSETVEFLKNSGLSIVVATEKAEQEYFKISYTNPLGIIMGSEGKGVSDKLISLADHWVRIPVNGKIDSLNVSNAAAILMYETVRQRLAHD